MAVAGRRGLNFSPASSVDKKPRLDRLRAHEVIAREIQEQIEVFNPDLADHVLDLILATTATSYSTRPSREITRWIRSVGTQ
jgi:hypothetical protein